MALQTVTVNVTLPAPVVVQVEVPIAPEVSSSIAAATTLDPITGAEEVPALISGVLKKATYTDIKAWMLAGVSSAWADITGKPTTFAPIIGSGAADAAAGNHTHSGVYAPVLGADDNYVTDAEKAALHAAATVSGNGISITGQQISLSIGTTPGTVAAGDDSRITGAAQKASNLSDLASASTARTNLGLGTAATVNVSTLATLAGNNTFSGTNVFERSLTTFGKGGVYVGSIRLETTGGANTYTTIEPSSTALRYVYLPDKTGTMAMISDITGTNSGTNTGDETGARIATLVNAATPIATMADDDRIAGTDTSASGIIGYITGTVLWAWVVTKLGALTSLTAGGSWNFSSTTRPTSSGSGTPAATSLITAADGDTRFTAKATTSSLTSDHAGVVSSTTVVDSGVSITLAAGTYELSGLLYCTALAAGGTRAQLTLDSATGVSCALNVVYGDGANGFTRSYATQGSVSSLFLGISGSAMVAYNILGRLVLTETRTLKLQYAQSISNGTATIAKAGSYLTAIPR